MLADITTGEERDPRERRRVRFRRHAQDVALALFTERGFEAVTMSELAAALDVSERTLFRYFPTKESLLDPAHEEQVDRLVHELQSRPAEESAFVAVREALRSVSDELDEDRANLLARTTMIESSPQLQAHFLRRQGEIEDAIATVVASRAGLDDTGDLRPALVAAATVAALRVALLRWAESDTDERLITSLERALDLLADGLGQV